MLIEISQLPPIVQEQILAVQQGETMQFSQNGHVIIEAIAKPTLNNPNQLIGEEQTFGLWKHYNIDGLEYQNNLRNEWVREWETE